MDIVVGLQYGDEGKGKVINHLLKDSDYTHCVRFHGGPNAGHTFYVNEQKYTTHQIPTGIFYNLICIIGPGCVIDIKKLEKEITMLENNGITDVRNRLKIAYNAHIISSKHIEDDIKNDKIGSTHSGIRPVYRDKYNRCGNRVIDVVNSDNILCGCEIIDSFDMLHQNDIKVLFEGAQGFMLDIDWGNYPYVTSSHCLSTMISTCGVSFRNINKVYGIAKIYNTYVGKMKFQDESVEALKKIQILGNEYGSTTGRKRQCNWLDLDELNRAIIINGVSDIIINKCDILVELGIYKLYHSKHLLEFKNIKEMQQYINKHIINVNIIYSYSKFKI